MRRGEVWWADLGPHRPLEQTTRRPVVIWQGDALTRVLQSVLVIPLTTNLSRASLAETRDATDDELAELELATDEALGRVEPEGLDG